MTARRPITIVELEQPRCALRFGVGLCTATGTKCYNTAGTCGDLANYDPTASIKWRFMNDRPGVFDLSNYSDTDNPEVQPIPALVSVSTAASEINAGSNLDGRSPLGISGAVSVTLEEAEWRDTVGDHYLTDRPGYEAGKPAPVRGNFWALWTARNLLFRGMYLRIYDGYEGEQLADMRQRLYILDNVNGPDANGGVRLTGLDPLRLAGDKKAEFPRSSKLDLYGDITATATHVVAFGSEADLTDTFGNVAKKYISIGKELIEYDGFTDFGSGRFVLSNVVRGALGTTASSHSDGDKIQRAGRYENEKLWLVLNDLLVNHTEMPASFIPLADWITEGDTYLPTFRATRTIIKPTPVDTLAGQITQQGLFYIWWSEYERQIKMLAVRPPSADPAEMNDAAHIMDGAVLRRDPTVRVTQVSVFYDQIDPFASEKEDSNYRRRFTSIDGSNLGEVRAKSIYAPWISKRTEAVQLAVRLLTRYRSVPKFLSFTIDAKDRETAAVGELLDIETRTLLLPQGELDRSRWQVISAKEVEPGHRYAVDCQTYEFVGKFAVMMPNGSPDYAAATGAEKQDGAWFANESGLMPDSSEGYLFQ